MPILNVVLVLVEVSMTDEAEFGMAHGFTRLFTLTILLISSLIMLYDVFIMFYLLFLFSMYISRYFFFINKFCVVVGCS